jgi:hypothetical protein
MPRLHVATLPLALLAGCALAMPAQAGALSQTQSIVPQLLLPPGSLTVSDTSPDGAAPVLVSLQTPLLTAFDAGLGVLVGVDGRLAVEPGHQLMAYRNESGGDWDSIARVRSTWLLGATVLSTGVLAQSTANRDTPVVYSDVWSPLSFTAGAPLLLDRFVGTGTLGMTLNTGLSAFISNGGGGSTAIASVMTAQGTPDPDGLTAGLTLGYSYLQHAQMSFAAGSLATTQALAVGDAATGFLLHALGGASTTAADFGSVACSGDCAAFGLELGALANLQPGAQAAASVRWLGGAAGTSARYTFTFADDDAVGAVASQRSHTLVLDVTSPAVPEPASAALWLAGLGLLATRWYNRGR